MHAPGAVTLALAVTACHAAPRRPSPPPPAEARVATAIRAWGAALERGDDEAMARAEDGAGQFALAYGAVKTVASRVPRGARAVEESLGLSVAVLLLQSIWPGLFGEPTHFLIVAPLGELGVPLVAAGLAAPAVDSPDVIVPVPIEATYGRIAQAAQAHRARLRARAAWTCAPTVIAHMIAPTDPSFVRMAAISSHVFAGWIETVDAIWLVQATCERGSGAFVVIGHRDPRSGAISDRVLFASARASASAASSL